MQLTHSESMASNNPDDKTLWQQIDWNSREIPMRALLQPEQSARAEMRRGMTSGEVRFCE